MAKKPTRKKAAKKAGKQSKTKKSSASKARPKARKAGNRPARKAPASKGKRPARQARRAKKPAGRATKPTAAATKRSTGSPAGAGTTRKAPGLDRERKRLREIEETVPTPPSSLNPDRLLHASAARSGRAALKQARRVHTETSPQLTGGDVDADWEEAYAVGDEAPGGDNPTPDQDRVDDIGKAMGIEYADNEELKAGDKIAERDRHRWELDPASAEDYPDHEED